MQLPRLLESLELNNALLVGVAATAALVLTWAALVATVVLLRKIVRAVRLPTLEPIVDLLYRRTRLLAVILSCAALLGSIGLLGWAIWTGRDLQPDFDAAVGSITRDDLLAVGRVIGLVLGLLIGFMLLQQAGRALAARAEIALRARIARDQQQAYVTRTLTHLPSAITLALAHAVVSLTVRAVQLPAVVTWLLTTVVYILLLISAGRTLVHLSYFVSDYLLWSREDKVRSSSIEDYYAALRRLLPVGQKSIEAIIYVLVATLIIRRFETLEPFAPYGSIIIRVIALFFAANVVAEGSRVTLAKLLGGISASADNDAQRRRNTVVSLLQTIVKYAVFFCVIIIVLDDLGIDPTPILAGAGIVGLAVGLGSQKIVEDVLSGVFLLFEDQILNGDYIRIGDTEGTVEELALRTTRIRDRFGRMHIVRNGQIQGVINYSRGWTLAVVEMTVAYESNLEEALAVIGEASAKLSPMFPGVVVDTPQVMGIEAMDDSCLRVRIEAKVAPGRHFEVKRALNRLLVDHFNEHGLEIPYPKAVEISGDSPAPAPSKQPEA